MADLRSYMSTAFFEDQLIIDDLERHMMTVTKTFYKSFDDASKSWAYELRPAASFPKGNDSQSTTAMILSSILAMREEWGKTSWKRAASGMEYFFDFPLPQGRARGLKEDFAESKLLDTIQALIAKWKSAEGYITDSKTFGRDDPMSLGWALDLIRWIKRRREQPNATDDLQPILGRIVRRCGERAAALVREAGGATEEGQSSRRSLCNSIMTPPGDRKVGDSSYILARFAAVIRSITQDRDLLSLVAASDRAYLDGSEDVLLERFETRLHDHLSFAEIVDSRFDPTELAFCLEGILLIRTDSIAKTVFDRVMSVLRIAQEKGAYWRSETPMLYRDNGDVLFTVSVEAANAVLAAFALFDRRWRLHDSVASEHIDLIKRYWRWLKTRKAIVRVGEEPFDGWHSEHVNDPNLIHLWETSQVAEFLVNFRDQLKRHVGRTSLKLAACSYKSPTRPEMVKVAGREIKTEEQRWSAASETLEPVSCLGERYRVFQSIGDRFIRPRLAQKGEPAYSMLLYGPPGTGKTTVASALSWALEYPLITITVSDFLADGHAAIEARAKDLFDMLQAQPRTVVFFDEIDQFVLDRDSEFFRDQETIFKFLTPGMLTKLNDLQSSKSVLFIMATNYFERIDRAIKRQGRIDQHFLLLPPDKERRKRMAEELWSAATIDAEQAAEASVFLNYYDMKLVSVQMNGEKAVSELKITSPTASADSYVERFKAKDGKLISDIQRTPVLEFIAMVALEVDATGKRPGTSDWGPEIESKCLGRFADSPPDKLKKEVSKFIGSTH
jgi:hypothetical protein